MKRVVFAAAIAILALKLDAQTSTGLNAPIYVVVDSIPKFPGGLNAFRVYIDKGVNRILKNNHPTGTIIAEIQIEINGKIKNEPGIVDGLPGVTDSVVIYLIKNTPPWKPGIKNGKPVRTLMRIPIRIHDSLTADKEQLTDAQNVSELEDDLTINIPWGTSDESKEPDPQDIYLSVEKAPEFPGGQMAFHDYIKNNRKLKDPSKIDSGKVVVEFVVEKDGSLTNILIIGSVSNACDAEAISLMKSSPKWHPGIFDGRPVRTLFSVQIYFKPDN